MLNKLKKNNKGFTIIEVLIVLAIAGLILLIVFLAVPALQRNSRNTQRRSDASKLLGAVTEWSNNNNGNMPATAAETSAALANAKLGILGGAGAVTWGNAWAAGVDQAVIAVNYKCNGNTAVTAQNRAAAVLYRTETGGGNAQQCLDS